MEKIFLQVYYFFNRNKTALIISLVLAFLCAGFAASKIKLDEDITAIIPKDAKTEKLNTVFQHSKFLDKLVVHVTIADSTVTEPDSLVVFTQALVEKAQQQLTPYIHHINDKVNDDLVLDLFTNVQEQLPLYLNDTDYHQVDSLTQPEQLEQTLAHNIQTLSSPSGIALKKMIANDPVGISFIGLKKLQQLQYDENFDLYDGYIVTKDHKHLLFFISPAYPPNNTGKNLELLQGLDAVIDSLHAASPGITASYYGATAVSAGNALQIRRDNMLTQGIAVVFIIVFVAWYFRKKSAPLIMLLPVAFGALFSLAIIYLLKGKISVIALGTGSVVLGIAINYSLHVFNHYRHTNDIKAVLKDLSTPMTIGSFTTIGGFFCLQFVQSELLKDVGLFAAFSLIGASLFSLVFLPHLIVSKKDKHISHSTSHSLPDKIALWHPEKNKWVIGFILALTIVFGYTSRYAAFESDMMRMNYLTPKLKQAEHELTSINAYALQSVYLLSNGKTLDEALAKNEAVVASLQQLKDKNVIQRFAGVSPVMLSKEMQGNKIAAWNNYWTEEKKKQVLQTLVATGSKLGYKSTAFNNFGAMLNKAYTPAPVTAQNIIAQSLLEDYIIAQPGDTMVVTMVKTPHENKTQVYKAFERNTAVTVVDKELLTNKLVEAVNADFTSIAIMSSLLVFIVLLITYGRIELALVTFIPMLITWIWILGIMGMFGIRFNIINIIISTLIFGLGDDYSIFIMDGLLQQYKTGKKLLSSYKSSIFISAITTIAGLGVLIFAKHPALRSIALISIIGIFCVVMMSQILIPLFFNLLINNRVEKKKFPWTITSFLKTLFAFTSFILGCILLNILGLLLIKLKIFGKTKSKLAYHTILSKFAWWLLYMMANVKKTVINPLHERFDKPAVVIANHQSFLDILSMIMLHPKLLLFTNNWVYHSPFFGSVVRMAGYYPVKEGAEQSIDVLQGSVAAGYSIVIFPEGTRSVDGKIKRFHKGAFFLAEQLKLDILPIVIHGTGYTIRKNDFFLTDGDITLQYLPRIKPDDTQWGSGYAIRAKKTGAYFREAYHQLKTKKETPDYFRETLHYNYLYKGPVLEWYMRIKVSLEKNYRQFHALVPPAGKVLDIGCGYGFLSYMLHFAGPERKITGIDYDEEKIATANHSFSKTDAIRFEHADALLFGFEEYDAIILSDILHYLQPDKQEALLKKCIQHLLPNGVIIIRDGNTALEKRHRGTKLSEFFSTKLLGFNKTQNGRLSFLHASSIYTIAATHNMECLELDETKLTSNIIFILKDKATVAQYESRH